MELPSLFKDRMRALLGEELDLFLESCEGERVQGLRLNRLKVREPGQFAGSCPFHLQKVAWAREGFYYGPEDRPGRHPFHEAGVYYIQEPSAMAVIELLDPRPGDCVLDLCAAPGGKTSHIASRLGGEGFLLSNEIHPARAKILSQNVERMGIANAVVTNEEPGRLAGYFPGFFDRIAVDAPCSGEGMFRKDEEARSQWSPENVALCASRQQEILSAAALMLKPGGRLVYSTCTFAPEEDEQAVERFIGEHPEFSVEEAPRLAGFSAGVPAWSASGMEELAGTVRIWPHRARGEGHFIAVLKKAGGTLRTGETGRKKPRYLTENPRERERLSNFFRFCADSLQVGFCRELFADSVTAEELRSGQVTEGRELILFGDQLYLLPAQMVDYAGLRVVRPGLHLGTFKKNRFEPSHALALALREDTVSRFRRFGADSREIAAYLRGETLPGVPPAPEGDHSGRGAAPAAETGGWLLVTVDGYSLGWAKLAGGILKNHYPKGLRRNICGEGNCD